MAPSSGKPSSEIVVNLHVTERCNYHCSFCFGRWGIGSAERDLFEDVDRAAALIADVHAVAATLRPDRRPVRFNFVGGEPALLRSLPRLVDQCRALGGRVSFVSNGLMLHRFAPGWIADRVAIVGLSVDSALDGTNRRIGRATRSGRTVDVASLAAAVGEIRRLGPARVKVNTVVSRANVGEDLAPVLAALRPDKWKVFQVLPVYGDRDAVTAAEFAAFLRRHDRFADILVSEDNDEMTGSYLMIDPLGRFFWRDGGDGYRYSAPILEVGAAAALKECAISWDRYAHRYERMAI